MRIILGDVYSSIENCPLEALADIKSLTKARPEGYLYMPKYKSGQWDGYISLMRGMSIPTGLLGNGAIQQIASKHGCSVKCVYSSNVHKVSVSCDVCADMLQGVTLRDYQLNAVMELLKRERGVAKMATNSGKTVVIAALIKALGNADALVIVQSKELLYQTSDRLAEMLGVPVGLIGDSHRHFESVNVATIQTLNSMKREIGTRFGHNRVLAVDECHHLSSSVAFDIIMKIPGWHRYGLSGTPLRCDKLRDLELIAATGPVAVDISNTYLIKHGWSAVPEIYITKIKDNSAYNLPYPRAYQQCIVESEQRNAVIAKLAADSVDNGPVLVIVTRIDHGTMLSQMIPGSIFLCGETDIEERMKTLRRMAQGDKIVVVATNIFDEGVDVPALNTLILAGGGKSYIKLLQRLGRGMRRKESGDNQFAVYDFYDNTNKYLRRHSESRIETYRAEQFDVKYIN